jgi:phosphatidylglycerol:prolipoprotein diacylglycerol transferase
MWQIFGLSFHWYGLLVGLAVVLAWWNLEALTEKHQQKNLSLIEWFGLVSFTLVCARAWHLITDWHRYESLFFTENWWQFFAVWQGGLSILGAVAGLVLGLWCLRQKSFLVWLDLLALVLPWSQAVGRVANWVNQELYGWPTQLFWGIAIDAEHRVATVRHLPSATKFHPLFAYEAVGVLLLGFLLTLLSSRNDCRPGASKIWWSYVLGYSGLRFVLDFLRIDRGLIFFALGFNQWFLLVCCGVSLSCLISLYRKQYDYTKTT